MRNAAALENAAGFQSNRWGVVDQSQPDFTYIGDMPVEGNYATRIHYDMQYGWNIDRLALDRPLMNGNHDMWIPRTDYLRPVVVRDFRGVRRELRPESSCRASKEDS